MLKQPTQHFRYSPVLLLLTVHGKYSFQFFEVIIINVSESVSGTCGNFKSDGNSAKTLS